MRTLALSDSPANKSLGSFTLQIQNSNKGNMRKDRLGANSPFLLVSLLYTLAPS